ncbi:MAG: hypothetical protein WCE21_01210 [Candidatus Babeliales bacterium]
MKRISLLMLTALLFTSAAKPAPALNDVWGAAVGVQGNDARVVGIATLGATAGCCGIILLSKGLHKVCTTPETCKTKMQKVSNKVGGLSLSLFGTAFTAIGAITILLAKDIVQEFLKWRIDQEMRNR